MEPTPDNHILLDTKTGVFDSSGGILSSESTGVSLYLPPNAIPHGVSQSIYFKVNKCDVITEWLSALCYILSGYLQYAMH